MSWPRWRGWSEQIDELDRAWREGIRAGLGREPSEEEWSRIGRGVAPVGGGPVEMPESPSGYELESLAGVLVSLVCVRCRRKWSWYRAELGDVAGLAQRHEYRCPAMREVRA